MQKSKTILLILILIFGVLNFIGNSTGKVTRIFRENPLVVAMTNNGNNYFVQKGCPMGYQKELLDLYSKYSGLNFQIRLINDSIGSDFFDKVDMVLSFGINDTIGSLLDNKDFCYKSLPVNQDSSIWLATELNRDVLFDFDMWLAQFEKTDDYIVLRKKYSNNNYKRKRNGISEFDELFKKHANDTFDWLFLSALVYQESFFNPDITSPKGAAGLMQLMPETAQKFGVMDIYNPEDNVRAGVRLLSYLHNQIQKSDIPKEEIMPFLLMSYNAGYGRMLQCRKLTEALGMNPNLWNDVKRAIDLMGNPELKEMKELSIPRFNGVETVNFVNNVSVRYQHYQQLFGS